MTNETQRVPCQERERLWSIGQNGEIVNSFCCFDCKKWFATVAEFKEHAEAARKKSCSP